VRWDLGKAVQQLKRESGEGLFVAGVKLPLAVTELGLIDEYEFVVQPRLASHGPTLFAGLSKHVSTDAREPAGVRLGGGGDALRAEKIAIGLAGAPLTLCAIVALWRIVMSIGSGPAATLHRTHARGRAR
jgi:hypothetical protein